MGRRVVDNFELSRWRSLDALAILRVFADHLKQDSDFKPRTSHGTTRWHVHLAGSDFEILCTGSKFLDTRANRGGGGAVDLVMHLFDIDFKQATILLRQRGL